MKKILLVVWVIPTLMHAQTAIRRADGNTITRKGIDQIIASLMSKGEVTGLAAAFINNNKPVYVKAYGYKNRVKRTLNDTATSFYAASLAKPLFAYLVMILADEKRIDLDRPLYTYLPKPIPEYPGYESLRGDERWKLITARHCLSHTTGFPNWRQTNPRNNNRLEIFFTPGKRYAYSGEGLCLLQLVVESITGEKLEGLAQRYVFKPLGMGRTSFLWQASFEKNFAVGHNRNEDTIAKTKATHENAAGSMETTIGDYARFIGALMQGKGISASGKEQMLSPQVFIHTKHQFPSLNNDTTGKYDCIQLAYGLGWGLFNSPYGKAFFKEGHGDGWTHYMIAFPRQKNAVILMTNSENGESIFKELTTALTGVAIPWEWEGYYPYRATVQVQESILNEITGVYDGKLKAIISLVDGKLKVESPTVSLPKSNLYAINDHRFFLKVMDVEIEFVRGPNGKIEKAILDDEGEHYELKKIQ